MKFHSFISLAFGLAVWSLDGPMADQNGCGNTDMTELHAVYFYSSGQSLFLFDDHLMLPMYDDIKKLGYKYDFRFWILQAASHTHSFRVRITTAGHTVSCSAPQTLVYTAAKPTHAGCCGKQVQCKHIGDVEKRNGGQYKSCIYECECVDMRCRCSLLVTRFYYVPWIGYDQLFGGLYHVTGI